MDAINIMLKNAKRAEASRRYRERQRGFKPARRQPKSASERSREYRARKKALLNAAKATASTENFDIPIIVKCESSTLHGPESQDEVARNSKLSVLSEPPLEKGGRVAVRNFDSIVALERNKKKAPGVTIDRTTADQSITLTPHLAISLRQTNTIDVNTCDIGDICAAKCHLDNGQFVLIAIVYILPDRKLDDIIEFINQVLLPYSLGGAALLKKDWGTLPIIMSGDFNVQFSKPESQPLIEFLAREFNLKMNNEVSNLSTKLDSTDTVFFRNLEHIKSQTFGSYFNYHKSIVTMITIDNSAVNES